MIKKAHPFREGAHPRLLSAIVFAAVFTCIFAMLATAVTPQQYDLSVGEVAPITITATKDVEDAAATQKLVDAAVAAVQPSYVSDETVLNTVLSNLSGAFSAFGALREGGEKQATDALLERANALLDPVECDEAELTALLECDETTLSALYPRVRKLVRDELNANVTQGQETDAALRVVRELQSDGYGDALVNLMSKVVRAHLKPNMLLDAEATEANRQKAAESVDPVVYKQGQNIVRSGEVVTKSQYDLLMSLGLLSSATIDFALYAGIGISLFLLLAALGAYLYFYERELFDEPKQLTLIGSILVITILTCLLTHGISVYLMPVTLAVMLGALLVKPRLSVMINVTAALIAGLLAGSTQETFSAAQLCVILSGVVSGGACNAVQARRQQRLTTLICGLLAAASNVVVVFAVLLMNNANISKSLPTAFYAAGSGILAGVMCIGLQPALEWMFNLLTQTKLLELSNPNHPLLRRLLIEAPGTYHHSIIVANLAEAGAASIGANGLLARVGAYYHDVGKLKRPLYFKENQLGDNPHDRTDPAVSSAILTVHPRDGVVMAKKYRIPKPILDIIEQHHGDTPTIYFYDRALRQNPEGKVSIDDFRYAGPRPQSVEAAVVMLADTVEAATRASGDADPAHTEQLIRRLIRAKLDDGQLSESPLTIRDLDRICVAFHTVLTGVFHERVEYPALPENPADEDKP